MQQSKIVEGRPTAEFWVVGLAPGEKEMAKGLPFVGASGTLLRRILSNSGLTSGIYFTNVAHTMPKGHSLANLSPEELKFGMDELAKDLRENKPKLILAVGGDATAAMTGESRIHALRGTLMRTNVGGHAVLPCLHPSYVLRVHSACSILMLDIAKASRLLRGGIPDSPSQSINRADTYEQAMEALKDWQPGEVASLDTEYLHNRLTAVSFCVKRDGEYKASAVPIVNADFTPRLNAEQLGDFFGLLAERLRECPIIGHNLYADEAYLSGYSGTFIRRVRMDTMVAHHLKFSHLPKTLAFCASLYLDWAKAWKVGREAWGFPRSTLDDFLEYACSDVINTYQVADLIGESGTPKHLNFYMQSIYPLMRQAMFTGLKVDRKRQKDVLKEFNGIAGEWRRKITKMSGEEDFNPHSPVHVKKCLLKHLPPDEVKDTSKEQLTALARKHEGKNVGELCSLLPKYRHLTSILNNSLSARLVDDCYLTEFKLCAAQTYRFAAGKSNTGHGGNLQNIPVREKLPSGSPRLREIFIPRQGYAFLEMDLVGADAQVAAWDSGDERLKEAFRSGVDVHQMNADALGCTRQIAKGFCHGANYGAGIQCLATACNLSVKVIREYRLKWFAEHPALRSWHESLKAQVLTNGYLENKMGYRGYFISPVSISPSDYLPFIPQSTVANVINIGMVRATGRFPFLRLLAQIHDSVLFEIPVARLKEWKTIAKAMEVAIPYSDELTIPVEVKYSLTNWAEMRKADGKTGLA